MKKSSNTIFLLFIVSTIQNLCFVCVEVYRYSFQGNIYLVLETFLSSHIIYYLKRLLKQKKINEYYQLIRLSKHVKPLTFTRKPFFFFQSYTTHLTPKKEKKNAGWQRIYNKRTTKPKAKSMREKTLLLRLHFF